MQLTRDNFETQLDKGNVFAAMRNGRWWRIRRNGKTQTWKTDASRIRIPVKAGLKSCAAITETDFNADGTIKADCFDHIDNIPSSKR